MYICMQYVDIYIYVNVQLTFYAVLCTYIIYVYAYA